MRRGAEHIIVFRFLEDARRAAIHQHQQLLQLLGDRRHRKAVAGADIAEHDVDIVALIQVAQFLHLLGGAAVLVDDDRLDLHAAEPDLLVRRGAAPLFSWSMTNWPPLRAGTPKLSAAGPDRKVTMPSLKVSCAEAGGASASASRRQTTARHDAESNQIHGFLPGWPAREPDRFLRARCSGRRCVCGQSRRGFPVRRLRNAAPAMAGGPLNGLSEAEIAGPICAGSGTSCPAIGLRPAACRSGPR